MCAKSFSLKKYTVGHTVNIEISDGYFNLSGKNSLKVIRELLFIPKQFIFISSKILETKSINLGRKKSVFFKISGRLDNKMYF